ncbi:MAG: hypothetical protein ACT4NY_10475 [Pseudonocardiales bacterium]
MSGFARGVAENLGSRAVARLAALERDSRGLRAPKELAALREELMTMVRILRRLLITHTPAEGARRCPACRAWWGWRRWPCPVWMAGRRLILDLDRPPAATTAASQLASAQRDTGMSLPGFTVRARHARPEPNAEGRR